MVVTRILLFSFITLVLSSNLVFAERKVCRNGKVSHSSCPEDFPTSIFGNNEQQPHSGNPLPYRPSSAKVIQPQLITSEQGRGLWKGHVRGDGNVRLVLEIIRAGAVVERREMGNVDLRLSEKPTRFNFQSMLPSGDNWSWKVLAFRGR